MGFIFRQRMTPDFSLSSARQPRKEYEEFKKLAYAIADKKLETQSQQEVQLWLNRTLKKLYVWATTS